MVQEGVLADPVRRSAERATERRKWISGGVVLRRLAETGVRLHQVVMAHRELLSLGLDPGHAEIGSAVFVV